MTYASEALRVARLSRRNDTLAFAAAWAKANPEGDIVIDGDRMGATYTIRTYEGDLMQTHCPFGD